jgi:hypothetical protein
MHRKRIEFRHIQALAVELQKNGRSLATKLLVDIEN